MGESMVAMAYGDALYEAAKKAGTEAEVLAEVVGLADLMETEDELRAFLASSSATKEEKKAFAETVLRGRVSEEMVRFLLTLNDREQVRYLTCISQVYRHRLDGEQNTPDEHKSSEESAHEEMVRQTRDAMSEILKRRTELEKEVKVRFGKYSGKK